MGLTLTGSRYSSGVFSAAGAPPDILGCVKQVRWWLRGAGGQRRDTRDEGRKEEIGCLDVVLKYRERGVLKLATADGDELSI